MSEDSPILSVRNLSVHFPIKRGFIVQREVARVRAVDGISFDIYPGETLGLVGESGSGKTTVAKSVMQLTKADVGSVKFEGQELVGLSTPAMRPIRRKIGMVFQDPYGSLNPRMRAGDIIGEPLKVHNLVESRENYRSQIASLLSTVGLSAAMAERYPNEFSGGQRQRLGIARAIAAGPSMLILDEAVSALDVSIQAQVLNLLQDLQEQYSLAYLFIAHDLSVVRHISHRVAVMYLGGLWKLQPALICMRILCILTPRRCYQRFPLLILFTKGRASASFCETIYQVRSIRHLGVDFILVAR